MVGNVNALQMGQLGSKSPNMQSPNQQGQQSSIANNMVSVSGGVGPGGMHVVGGGGMPINSSMPNNSNVSMQGKWIHRLLSGYFFFDFALNSNNPFLFP
jgi:hypothetical protein